MSNNYETNKVFWSPSVKWIKRDDKVRIEIFSYSKPYSYLFPEFYFATQNGILEGDLLKLFKEIDSNKLKIFINDLKKKRVLVDTILSPAEIFYPENILLQHDYDETLIIDKEALEKFKQKNFSRNYFSNSNQNVELSSVDDIPNFIYKRKSIRKFNTKKLISFFDFSFLASIYKQIFENEKIRYLYSSAGGLYPIDVYYYIKKDRVENIAGGLYYYNPQKNMLTAVDLDCHIPKEAHYFMNQEIFLQSAFSIFYIYNGEVSMPKYGGLGYYYGIIDLGIMVEAYTIMAELKNIGTCSIGEMNFKAIEKYFKLKENQKYFHTIEVGISE
ncbi:SagB/ThcOx family dehydrogenase [Clostridium felsineum]|uniref:SagB/ThcOx family dehydrogenase n=1 Tax=Clostridium felsineum TaxID=36839 RepID=UPI00214DC5F9|nr:SagB/ThcOx family dehydrogenase [Clostridium felsineum]MCR3758485.1 SagB/ThcOx family dehydrogenase [Clostridium felsineum]